MAALTESQSIETIYAYQIPGWLNEQTVVVPLGSTFDDCCPHEGAVFVREIDSEEMSKIKDSWC